MSNLQAGPELDALIAEKVMGLKLRKKKVPNGHGHPAAHYNLVDFWYSDHEKIGHLPHYSTDISAAWQVMEKLKARVTYPGYVDVATNNDKGGWSCCLVERSGEGGHPAISAPTAQLAICLTALDAVGIKVQQS